MGDTKLPLDAGELVTAFYDPLCKMESMAMALLDDPPLPFPLEVLDKKRECPVKYHLQTKVISINSHFTLDIYFDQQKIS